MVPLSVMALNWPLTWLAPIEPLEIGLVLDRPADGQSQVGELAKGLQDEIQSLVDHSA